MQRRPPRKGITLLELLVVLAIGAALIGLLLPAVQKVRSAAARAECSRRLNQLGLALQGYHDTHAAFPPGVSLDDGRSQQPFLSWNARVLPFLGEEALWKAVQQSYLQDPDFLHVPPHVHRGTVVPAFACPADPRAGIPSTKLGDPRVAFTSYLGVSGRTSERADGLLFLDSHVRITDVTDGTSSTLLAGERPPSADERYGWWYAGWGQSMDGSAEMVLGVEEFNWSESGCAKGPYRYGDGGLLNQCDLFHYWSLHPGGGSFLFVDGSVRFLPYSAYATMPALATRAGGDVGE
jgi:prepilin-type processing-associated H-X9-DG protein